MDQIFLKATPEQIKRYQEYLAERHPESTFKRKTSSLRRFFDWAKQAGHIQESPLAKKEEEKEEKAPQGRRPANLFRFLFASAGLVTLAILVVLMVRRLPIPLPIPGIAVVPPGQEVIAPSPTPTVPPPVVAEEKPEIPTIGDKLTAKILELLGETPKILAPEGKLSIESLGINLVTTPTSDGDITLAPDGVGQVLLRSSTTSGDSFQIANANLTTGNLITGYVGHSGQDYKFIEFANGVTPEIHFSVDALGNTFVGGEFEVGEGATIAKDLELTTGDLKTTGTTRLTNTGSLENITGYEQEEGDFSITQAAGDSASIIKQTSATSDVLTLTLDERGTPNSIYSALTLKRYNGAAEAMALLVDEGNARFDGQLQLGRFASNPTSIGQGSLVFNTSDTSIYVWNGTSWVNLGGGSTAGFWQRLSGVLSPATTTDDLAIGGTDATAPFFVNDSGTVTSSSTIQGTQLISTVSTGTAPLSVSSTTLVSNLNVDQLDSLDSGQFLRSDTSDNYTSGTLTTDAGTTLDVNGDLKVADTLIDLDGGATTIQTTSGALSLKASNLEFEGTTSASSVEIFRDLAEAGFGNNGIFLYSYNTNVGGSRYGRLYVTTGGLFRVDPGVSNRLALDYQAENLITAFEGSASGENREFRIYGYNTALVGTAYGLLQYDDSDDRFRIDVSTGDLELDDDTYITGLLNVAGTLTANGDVDLGDVNTDTVTFTARVDSNIEPSVTDTYDLGSASLIWNELFVNQVCFDGASDCITNSNSAGPWTLSDPVVYPDQADWRVGIGTTTAGDIISPFFVTSGATVGKALAIFNQTENQEILVASKSGTTKFVVDTNGRVAIGWSGGVPTLTNPLEIFNEGTTQVASFTTAGNLQLDGDLAVDGGDITTTAVTFNLINATATTINFAGAATTLNIADSTATKTIDIGGVTSSGSDTINIATEGTAADTITIGNSNASTLLALTGGDDWSISNTGILTLSASAAQTTAILVTDTDYTNAISVGDNNIIGTTANIDLTNFDVTGSTGDITTAGDIAINGGNITSTGDLDINASGGDLTIPTRVTVGSSTAGVGKLTVTGAEIGKALVIFNETGDQNILTASASGTTVANLDRSGNLSLLNQGDLRLYELTASGTDYTGFQAPDSVTTTVVYKLPAADGSSNQLLSTSGTGSLSWIDVSGGAGSLWTDGGTYLYPTNRESMRVYDSAGTDYVDLAHDGTDATFSFANTTALNINVDSVPFNNWAAASGQVEILSGSTNYVNPGIWVRAGFNAGSRRAFFRAANVGAISLSLGDGLTGGDFAQYRSDSGDYQVYFDSDAAESAVGHTFYARLQVGSTNALTLQGDSGTLSSGGDLTIDATGNDVVSSDRWTIGSTTAGVGKLTVTGAEIGKALVILNETGDQNILTASASGTTVANLDRSGNLSLLAQGDIRLYDSDNSNYTGFQAPTDVTSTVVYSLPAADGSSGFALTTSGTGVLSWTDFSGGSFGPWTQTGSVLYPDTISWRVGIGTTTAGDIISPFFVTSGATVGKALAIFNQTENQEILVASKSGTTKFVVDTNGRVAIGWSGGVPTLTNPLEIFNEGTTQVASFTTAGNLQLDGDLAVDGGDITSTSTTLTLGGSITTLNCTDCIDFDDLADSMSLDAATTFGVGIAANLTINLSSTGDFVIADAGTPKFTFTDSGSLDVASASYIGINSTSGRLVFSDLATDVIDVETANLDLNANPLTGTTASIDFDNFDVAGTTGNVTTAGDVAVNGGNITSTVDLDINASGGDLTVPTRATIGSSTAGVAKLTVTGAEIGKALVILNETGNQNILTASAAATPVLNLTNAGFLIPGQSDNAQDIGSSSNRWRTGYFGTSVVVGSTTTINTNDITFSTTNPSIIIGNTGTLSFTDGSNTLASLADAGTTGNLTITGDIVVNGGDITTTATTLNIDVANTGTIQFRDGTNALAAIKDQGAYAFFNLAGKTDTGNPASCAEGDIYYNAFDDTISICHSGSTWEQLDGGGATFWTQNSGTLYPSTISDKVGIGTQTPGDIISSFYVTRNTASGLLGKAVAIFNQTEAEDILTASASGTTRLTLANDGTLKLANATSTISNDSGDITINAASNTISFAGDTITNFGQATGGSGSVSAPTYSFSGDPNSGLYSSAADEIRLVTGGADRLTINSSGNVGIGTTGPDRKLDVLDASNPQLRLTQADATQYADLQVNSSGNLSFTLTGTTLTLTRTSLGAGDFQIAQEDGTVAMVLAHEPLTRNNQLTSGNWVITNPTGGNVGQAALIVNQAQGGGNDIFTASASGATRFVIQNDGNVGIGTTNPGQELDVAGDITLSGNIIGDATDSLRLQAGGATGGDGGNGSIYFLDSSGNTRGRLETLTKYGDGTDGAITLSGSNNCQTTDLSTADGDTTADCIATNLTAGATANDDFRVTVASTTGFYANDEVLLTQMLGTGAGNYETKIISSVDSSTQVTFTSRLERTYQSTNAQMVRIPQYTNVTINSGATLTVSAWNGTTGGVLFFRATGTVSNSGTIDLNALGGGGAAAGSSVSGGGGAGCGTWSAGSGSSGTTGNAGSTGTGSGGGGGGGAGGAGGGGQGVWSPRCTAGGGGGGSGGGGSGGSYGVTASTPNGGASGGSGGSAGCNAGSSGSAGSAGSAGSSYGDPNFLTLFMGSGGGGSGSGGGGAGGACWNEGVAGTVTGGNGGSSGGGATGGTGGGIVVIAAATISNGSGTIRSNGANGQNGSNGSNGANGFQNTGSAAAGGGGGGGSGGSGGGGSGGAVWLISSNLTAGTVQASGGSGGGTASTGGNGGHCAAGGYPEKGGGGGGGRSGVGGSTNCQSAGNNGASSNNGLGSSGSTGRTRQQTTGIYGTLYIGAVDTTSADIAEYYVATDSSIAEGDIVSIGPTDIDTKGALWKSEVPYDPKLVGVISSSPGIILGSIDGDSGKVDQRALALSGRVPANVSSENGPIRIGDFITSSSLPGIGMKATKAGPVVAKALEDLSFETAVPCLDNPEFRCGTIMVFLNLSSYDPDVYLTDTGDLTIAQVNSQSSIVNSNEATDSGQLIAQSQPFQLIRTLTDGTQEIIQRIGVFSEAVVAQLRAGLIEAQLVKTQELVSPVVETTEISTGGENLVIDLQRPSASDSAEISEFGRLIVEGNIEITGNATISGRLTAEEVEIQELTVDKIYANEVVARSGSFGELLSATSSALYVSQTDAATLSARISTLEQQFKQGQIQTGEPQTPTLKEIEQVLAEAEADQALTQEAQSWETGIATGEAQLTTFFSSSNSLPILGDLSLTGSLYVGADLVIQTLEPSKLGTSIDTLSAPLAIQSLAAQPLQIMGEKILIATNGDVRIKGNVTIEGSLAVNELKPLPEQDLIINLQHSSSSDSAGLSGFGNLLVKGFDGQTVASIDASGSAQFAQLATKKLVIASSSDASSSGELSSQFGNLVTAEIQTNATAGQAILPAGTTDLIVRTSLVTDNTLVYVTPTSSTQNQVLYVKAKLAGEYFVVGVDEPIDLPISFNYWIIELAQE